MERLDDFITMRQRNFAWLSKRLSRCGEQLILPQATTGSEPSWFGFPLTLRDGCGIERVDLLRHLDQQKVGTRLLFGGNLTRQPYMQDLEYRVSGKLAMTDKAMRDTFWIGLWPGLSEAHLEHAARSLENYLWRTR
jgi:CDP-6-deoxy-D-xylo-4-hexulose-3-dehydrase